MGLHM